MIDTWYAATINTPTLAARVQKVALNDPDFTAFSAVGLTSNSGPENWNWNNWYQDTRFATTLTASGSQQAFALSYGDIHGHMGVPEADYKVPLLYFSSSAPNYLWLRSAGGLCQDAGYVDAGYFNYSLHVDYTLPVRPALSLLIQ
ncbi:MAG: hypothetical protein ACFWTQ_06250 [Lactococcus sp.]|jgi:hypothetical protein